MDAPVHNVSGRVTTSYWKATVDFFKLQVFERPPPTTARKLNTSTTETKEQGLLTRSHVMCYRRLRNDVVSESISLTTIGECLEGAHGRSREASQNGRPLVTDQAAVRLAGLTDY